MNWAMDLLSVTKDGKLNYPALSFHYSLLYSPSLPLKNCLSLLHSLLSRMSLAGLDTASVRVKSVENLKVLL